MTEEEVRQELRVACEMLLESAFDVAVAGHDLMDARLFIRRHAPDLEARLSA